MQSLSFHQEETDAGIDGADDDEDGEVESKAKPSSKLDQRLQVGDPDFHEQLSNWALLLLLLVVMVVV